MLALVCALFVLPSAVHGPGTVAQAQDRAIETGNAITTGGDIEADRATSELIRQRLRAIYRELDGLAGVFVTVNSGVVTLSGTVAEPDLAEEAIAFARRAEDAIAVRDRITISTSLMQRLVPALDRLERRSLTAVA